MACDRIAAQCSSLLQTSGKVCKASVWPVLGKGCDSSAFSVDPHGNTTVKIKITVLVRAQERLSAAVTNIKPLAKPFSLSFFAFPTLQESQERHNWNPCLGKERTKNM